MPGYISEIRQAGAVITDFVEIAVPTGTDMSGYSIYVYNNAGAVQQGPLSLGTVQSTVAGKDVYVVNNATPGFVSLDLSQGIALVDDAGNVVQFISSDGTTVTATEGPASGQTSADIGTHLFGESLQSDDGGASYYVQSAPNAGTVPCYAPGTLIDTPEGPRVVEVLEIGDLVLTRDHTPQPIRWIRCGDQPLEKAEVEAKPVQIKAGALGRGLPAQDLIVSPQHRILVGGAGQLDGAFTSEAFVPAKSLTAVPGIRHMKGKEDITWIHFACDRHEVVTANGCLTESLLLGPMVVNGLTAAERRVVIDIYGPAPSPDAALNGPPARDCLTVGAVRRQIANHLQDKGRRLAREIRKWDRDLAMEKFEAERLREAS